MRTFVLVALGIGCFAGSVRAQDRTVPRDLVLGLFAHEMPFDSTQPMQIVVGRVPDQVSLPKVNLPVLGALQHNESVSIVYRVSGDLKEARRTVQAQLRAAGWVEPTHERPPDVGFVGIETEMLEVMPLCRGEEMAMIHTGSVRSDLRILRIDLHRMDGCSSGMAVGWTSYSPLGEETPLPKLEPPKNARVFGSMVPGSVTAFSSSAFIVSDLTTGQIMEHYGAQMHAKGWSSRGGTNGEFSSVHTWRIAQDGKEWMASMIATPLPEKRHVIEVNVYNLTQLTR